MTPCFCRWLHAWVIVAAFYCLCFCWPQRFLAVASGEEAPEVLFELSGDQIVKGTAAKSLSPLKRFVTWAEGKVLDAEELIHIRDFSRDEVHFRESRLRSVLDTTNRKLYFIRTSPVDKEKAAERKLR